MNVMHLTDSVLDTTSFILLAQEQQAHRRKVEEESLKNSVLDSAAAARFSTAAALEAAKEKGIAGMHAHPLIHPCTFCNTHGHPAL